MQKKTIATTILATAVLTPIASADTLLFPVITRSSTVSTFISVANQQATPAGQLFVNYFNKTAQPGTADFVTPCVDEGRRQLYSHGRQNDLVSWDASGNFQTSTNGGPLFNDPATLAGYGAADFKMGGTNVARGFLIVDDNTNAGESLYGEAFLMDIVNGAAWGYRAYNAMDDNNSNPLFANGAIVGNDPLGEVLDNGNGTGNAAITILPPSEWTTRFFVTPVRGTNTPAAPNGQRSCANCSANIYLSSDKAGTMAGLFDRDTTPQSMAFAPAALPISAKNIVCTAGPSLQDLMPIAQFVAIQNQGGWGYVQVRAGTSDIIEDSAVVIKLEFNLTSSGTTTRISPDTSRTFSGIVNTALWLRNVNNAQGVSGF